MFTWDSLWFVYLGEGIVGSNKFYLYCAHGSAWKTDGGGGVWIRNIYYGISGFLGERDVLYLCNGFIGMGINIRMFVEGVRLVV